MATSTEVSSDQRSSNAKERPRARQSGSTRQPAKRSTNTQPEVVGRERDGVNVSETERGISVAAGTIAAVVGLTRANIPGLLMAGLGGALVYRGLTGHCSMYSALDVNTAKSKGMSPKEIAETGFHVQQTFAIKRTPEELYKFWRNLENLPQIMSHLKSVTVIDEKRSHWIAKAPRIAGGQVEWDAEITRDEANAVIAWRSLPGGDVENAGQVSFERAPGDRGTTVRVSFDYVPPAGRLGKWVAGLFGDAPSRQAREDLRIFKRVMETGEAPSTKGQSRGSCSSKDATPSTH